MPGRYILRLDDIAPNMNWTAFEQLRSVVDACGVRPLLGVIPDNRDPALLGYPPCPTDFWQAMRRFQSRGWGIAMHGYQHLYETQSGGLLARSAKSEFAGLGREAQREKIRRGKAILEARGLRIDCFMAPSHSFDADTLRVLKEEGILWLSDGFALYPYRWRGMSFMPQILANPRKLPIGIHSICIHLNTVSDGKMQRLIRFLTRHAASFLSFEEATRRLSRLPGNRLLGVLLRRAIISRRH